MGTQGDGGRELFWRQAGLRRSQITSPLGPFWDKSQPFSGPVLGERRKLSWGPRVNTPASSQCRGEWFTTAKWQKTDSAACKALRVVQQTSLTSRNKETTRKNPGVRSALTWLLGSPCMDVWFAAAIPETLCGARLISGPGWTGRRCRGPGGSRPRLTR